MDAKEAFQRELTDADYRDQVMECNLYNRRIYQVIHDWALHGEGVLLSWTTAYRHARYGEETGPPFAALKSFILSSWTDLAAAETVVRQVVEAREYISSEDETSVSFL